MKHIAFHWASRPVDLEKACKAFFVGAEVVCPTFYSLPLDDLQKAMTVASLDPQDPEECASLFQICVDLWKGSPDRFSFNLSVSPKGWEMTLFEGLVLSCSEPGWARIRVKTIGSERAEALLVAIYAMNGVVPHNGWSLINEGGKKALAVLCDEVGNQFPPSLL